MFINFLPKIWRATNKKLGIKSSLEIRITLSKNQREIYNMALFKVKVTD